MSAAGFAAGALILFWTVSDWIDNDDTASLLVAAIAGIGFVLLVLITEDWRSSVRSFHG